MKATIEWKDAKTELPDSDIEVLICVSDKPNQGEVWMGHHDGERWRCASGARVGVSHWAETPKSPVS